MTMYPAQVPLAFGLGEKLGSVPAEQHTCSPGVSVEQSVGLGLYSVKSAAEMPHSAAREAQLSPQTTFTVEQVVRGSLTCAALVEVEAPLVAVGSIGVEYMIVCHVEEPL